MPGSSWDDLIRVFEQEMAELSSLSGRVQQSLEEYSNIVWDHLTESGSLTLPGQQYLYQSVTSTPASAVPTPPPSLWQRVSSRISRRPWFYGLLLSSVPLAATLYTKRQHIARLQAARKKTRQRPGRSEACLVVGVQPGHLSEALCLDLVHRGFVVIATVNTEEHARQLEKQGRGFIRALHLDVEDALSVSSCIKGVSTALSLKYPLHSQGDPFHNGRHLSLTGIVNCLAFQDVFATAAPLEASNSRQFGRAVSDILSATLSILQGALPLLRNSSHMALSDGPATVLTLVPAASAALNLPFTGGRSALDAALLSLVDSLRRELECASVGNQERRRQIRFMTLDVSGDTRSPLQRAPQSPIELPRHLQFYHAAASRRTGAAGAAFPQIPADQIGRRISKMILGGGLIRHTSVGKGAWTYRAMAYLPTPVVDLFFTAQDYVSGRLAPHHVQRPTPRSPSTLNSQPSKTSAASDISATSLPSLTTSSEGHEHLSASVSSLGAGISGSEWQELHAE